MWRTDEFGAQLLKCKIDKILLEALGFFQLETGMYSCFSPHSSMSFIVVTPFHHNVLQKSKVSGETFSRPNSCKQTFEYTRLQKGSLSCKAATCVSYSKNCNPCVNTNTTRNRGNESDAKNATSVVRNANSGSRRQEKKQELCEIARHLQEQEGSDKLSEEWDIEKMSTDELVKATVRLEKSLSSHKASNQKVSKVADTRSRKQYPKYSDVETVSDRRSEDNVATKREQQKNGNSKASTLDVRSVTTIRRGKNTVFNLKEYLEHIQQCQSLRQNEELKLTENVKRVALADSAFKELCQRLDREPTVDEWANAIEVSVEKLEEIMKLGRISKQALVTLHMGLIRMIANEVLRSRFSVDAKTSFMDLVQEGSVGVLRAAEKFDGKLGWRFSTYAAWWIRATMNRALEEHSRSVHIPVGVIESYHLAKKSETALTLKLGRAPTDEEVAKEMGVSVKKLRLCIQSVHNRPMSLDSFFSTSDNSANTDRSSLCIPDSESEGTVDKIVESMLRSDLQKLIDEKLKPQEKRALMLRFGLEDGAPKTLEECGKIMRISCERVRKIVLAGLEKLRHPSVIRKLEVYA